jgi:hypothetical protein
MVRSFAVALFATVDATRFLNQDRSQSRTMDAIAPYMHSTDAIHQELQELSQRCHNMKLDVAMEGDRSIDVVTVRDPSAQVVNKNFLLFGEHARELISAESGLHFIQTLCGENELSESAQDVLKDSEFQIVVNGNPASRSRVEQGEYCLRVNPNGVDLNRNWDEKWQGVSVFDSADTNPGSEPFSEAETRIFKELVESYKPTTFLTVHSGTKGMYMPWAFDMDHLASRNEPEMMSLLRHMDNDHCQCPYGAAGREVGYSCPGTCLDWVYDKLKTQFAFAFEIYTGPEYASDLRQRWEEKMRDGPGAFYQLTSHLAHKHFQDLFEKHPSSFIQLSTNRRSNRDEDAREPGDCFAQFNPGTIEDYKSTVDNWSSAYLQMASQIARRLRA